MTKFPSALMQKANELNYRVQNFDTYSGDDLNKTILLQKIIYHAKDLLIEALNEIDYDVEYLISHIENMDEDGELNDIIDSLTEIENDKELSDWEEHSTMNKNGTGCK
jgi:predicted ATP-grasp superfamily ATP-dependent carboligase